MELPISLLDLEVIDASKPTLHQAGCVELPILVSVGAEPLVAVIMPFICKTDSDPIFGKGPQLLYQPIIQFLVPFAREKRDDLAPAIYEF
jgi:hypothetical protein